MTRDENDLDYSPSSGSVGNEDAQFDSDKPVENDGRNETVTGFDPSDADHNLLMSNSARHTYHDLMEQHQGIGDDGHHQNTRKAEQRRDAATFCSRLDLTNYQKERVIYQLHQIDIDEMGQTNVEEVIMTLISLAHRADVVDIDTPPIDKQPRYEKLLDDLSIDSSKIRRLRTKIQREYGFYL